MNRLEVKYPFYVNFSKYLKQMSLKYLGGVDDATDRVLDEIKSSLLTPQDITILLNFQNEKVSKAILVNQHLPILLRYKLIIKYHLYDMVHCLKYGKNSITPKMRVLLLKHTVQYYSNSLQQDYNYHALFKIYDTLIEDWKDIPVPLTSAFIDPIVYKYVHTDSRYRWNRHTGIEEVIERLPSSKILESFKRIGIGKDYQQLLAVLSKINEEPPSAPTRKGLLKTLHYYINKELPSAPRCNWSRPIERIISELHKLTVSGTLNKRQIKRVITKIPKEPTDTSPIGILLNMI